MTSKLKRLHNQEINPFMPETDPKNPYGPNYEELPYDTKIYYKFNRIRKFVHFDQGDQEKIVNSNYEFVLGMTASLALGSLFALGLRKYGLKHIPRLDDWIDSYSHIYYGLFFAGTGTASYYYYSDKYIKDICEPFTEKYLSDAIKNGFDNYEISQFRRFKGDFKDMA
jgi:hypothetical protein